jgi:hypothetical protein
MRSILDQRGAYQGCSRRWNRWRQSKVGFWGLSENARHSEKSGDSGRYRIAEREGYLAMLDTALLTSISSTVERAGFQ